MSRMVARRAELHADVDRLERELVSLCQDMAGVAEAKSALKRAKELEASHGLFEAIGITLTQTVELVPGRDDGIVASIKAGYNNRLTRRRQEAYETLALLVSRTSMGQMPITLDKTGTPEEALRVLDIAQELDDTYHRTVYAGVL